MLGSLLVACALYYFIYRLVLDGQPRVGLGIFVSLVILILIIK